MSHNNQNSPKNVGDTQSESIILLEAERTSKGGKVIAALIDSKKFWEIFSLKQDKLHRLYPEVIMCAFNSV